MKYIVKVSFLLALAVSLVLSSQSQLVTAQEADSLGQPAAEEGLVPEEFIAAPTETFMRAKVVEILEEGEQEVSGKKLPYQFVDLRIVTGAEEGKELVIEHGTRYSLRSEQLVHEGQTVVVRKLESGDQVIYEIVDSYRLPGIAVFALGVILLTLLIAGKRGFAALISLAVSFWMLLGWVIPEILAGTNPFFVSILGGVVIATVTMYLTHGWRRETTVALGGILITIVFAAFLAWRATDMADLLGLGSESAYLLQFGPYADLDLRGLLLAGMIFGTLGILDDITTAQTATIRELLEANRRLKPRQLFTHGMAVGRVHIASLVNTLVLAYAGASLALFLSLVVGQGQPLWVMLNSEFLAEEIMRTLVGSAALLLAVPISTFLAAWFIGRESANANSLQ